jgi:hypothetical protein
MMGNVTILNSEAAADFSRGHAVGDVVSCMRDIGLASLARMYCPEERLFHFRLARNAHGIVPQGLSHRYTAIALIGLAGESPQTAAAVLGKHSAHDVCERMIQDAATSTNLGDVALTCWAAIANQHDPEVAFRRMLDLRPELSSQPTVEFAWALTALCVAPERGDDELRNGVAERLMQSFSSEAGIFPHNIGTSNRRSHVACFADQVYPILALSEFSRLTGNRKALSVASRCARQICSCQGAAGQWWWHYDARTGDVIEGYPVYAIHQDAMGPMALFALRDAGGPDFSKEINLGLSWLASAPELDGGSLIDDAAGVIWRKVARREPNKFTRYAQAAASWLHPSLRVPAIDATLPARIIDYETRPYHIGWMLYAIQRAGSTWKV